MPIHVMPATKCDQRRIIRVISSKLGAWKMPSSIARLRGRWRVGSNICVLRLCSCFQVGGREISTKRARAAQQSQRPTLKLGLLALARLRRLFSGARVERQLPEGFAQAQRDAP